MHATISLIYKRVKGDRILTTISICMCLIVESIIHVWTNQSETWENRFL